jgi:hypothetical protein
MDQNANPPAPLDQADIDAAARIARDQAIADHIHQQIQDGIMQYMANNPPAPLPAPVKNKTYVAKPDIFDGSQKQLRQFIRQCSLYITDAGIVDDEKKTLFILSYMKGGVAEQWVQNLYDRAREQVVRPDGVVESKGFPPFRDFVAEVEATFGNPNESKDAQYKLSALKQTGTAEEFFQLFDQYRRSAGYWTAHDGYLIELLEKALSFSIIQTIYTGDVIPITYAAYKEKAIRLDNLQRRFKINRPTTTTKPFVPKWSTPQNPTSPPQTSSTPKSGGQTFKGQGQPMVIDGMVHFGGRRAPMTMDEAKRQRLCWNCGQQGHGNRFCKEPRLSSTGQSISSSSSQPKDARAFVTTLSDSERSELIRALLNSGPSVTPFVSPPSNSSSSESSVKDIGQ